MWALQLYMPHNNMLWLWERMGIIGFGAFWAMVGSSLLLVIACVRLGLERLRTVVAEAQARLPTPMPGLHQVRNNARLHGADAQDAQECAEFLVLALLLFSLLATLMALGSADQGFMSFRLMPYTGTIAGALAGAWETYARRYAALPEAVPQQLITQEKPVHVHRRRVRIFAGP